MTRGFITLASGDCYCRLAEHLYMSYKLFSGCDEPFCVITDEEGKARLSKTFDQVIVTDLNRDTVDKLKVFTHSPFDETVFIDADCSVVNDLNYVFDVFEENASDISAISRVKKLEKGEKGVQFSAEAAQELGLTVDLPKFNGGVYWCRKSKAARECVDFMLNDVLPKYHHYGLLSNEKMVRYDEPVVIVGMLKCGMKTVPVTHNIMFLLFDKHDKVKWNMKKGVCFYPWEDTIVSPSIIHWKFGGTETLMYERYDAEVRGRYYHQSRLTIQKNKFKAFIKYKVYPKALKVFPGIRKAIGKVS